MFFGGIPALGEEKVFSFNRRFASTETNRGLFNCPLPVFALPETTNRVLLFNFLPFLAFWGRVFEVRKYNQAKGDKMW